ncbi:uncharacterized protein LOC125494694 [Beta vulgaris subsp. vulgaris]|uniref:uncharacterized protein LOC125494694 n=1 Tax=Beta vulgaris subsp. vulgaris TaxID=3555 RepID=UPI0020373F18|nr:uncharacterized protein LOC125494694 [Beta vulgaris subsp. vulgaris]
MRGMNNPTKQQEIRWFLNQNGIGLFSLLETKVKAVNFPKVYAGVCPNWSVVTNLQHHRGRRIWIIWQPGRFYVDILECDAQYIHCKITHNATGKMFYWTVVYGYNEVGERCHLWRCLGRVKGFVNDVWIIGGDFNNVLNLHERIGSAVTLEEVDEFRQCLRTCEMNDLSFNGHAFSWSNKQEGESRVCSKIDRVIGNDAWLNAFPNATISFLPEGCSDHTPYVINLDSLINPRPKTYRFFNMWTEDVEFMDKVQGVWSMDVSEIKMYQMIKKLRSLKRVLKELNRKNFSDVDCAADNAYRKLLELQVQEDP